MERVGTAAVRVATDAATARELIDLWRRWTGNGKQVSPSGRLLALGWVNADGLACVRSVRGAQGAQGIGKALQFSVGELTRELCERPEARFMLVRQSHHYELVRLERDQA